MTRLLATWQRSLAIIPGVTVGALPACPVCWPVYAGLMSSVGLGFLLETKYLVPLTTGSLLLALSGLGYRAEQRRGYGPLWAGVLATTVLLVGKFRFDSDPAMYLGVAILVAAAVYNAWPRRESERDGAACSCADASRPKVTRTERRRREA